MIPSASKAREQSIQRAMEVISAAINDAIKQGKVTAQVDQELLSYEVCKWLKGLEYNFQYSRERQSVPALITWREV